MKLGNPFNRRLTEKDKTMADTYALLKRANAEAERARKIFPEPHNLLLALVEEHGEVVKAALDIRQKAGSYVDLDKEIVQCMAMCIRLHEDGDPAVGVEPVVRKVNYE
jgi:NTP pyrophosphatase (non-canonical NTP hydrolase)